MTLPLRAVILTFTLTALATATAQEPLPETRKPQTIPGPAVSGEASQMPITREDAMRLQIFLDESQFGPGVIDGRIGTFTNLAVDSWCEVRGLAKDDWTPILIAARKAVPSPFATAVVPAVISDWVDTSLPYDKPGQALKKRMSYRRVSEFMAERYHTDEEFLRAINGSKVVSALKENSTLLVPNVTPFLIEDITGASHLADPELSLRHVVVDTKIKQVRIFKPAPAAMIIAQPGAEIVQPKARKNTGLIASFPITPGRSNVIRHGSWELRNMVELPWWRYDQKFLDTGERGPEEERLNIPPGPNSPVGIIWNGTSRSGIGLHGTSDPQTIGRARSSGCIRLCNWDAIRLPTLVRPGATVEIR